MAKQSKALVKEAEALGIDVDGRWGDETIQEKIDEREAAIVAMDTANAEAGIGPDGGSPIAKQVEALTDGEGDPATSGEAGQAAGVEVGSSIPADDRVSSEDRQHTPVSEVDAPGEADATVAGQSSLVERDDVSGLREPDERPEGEPAEDVAAGGSAGGATDVGLTDDPVAEAEDAPDDDAEEGEAADLGDGSADGASDDDAADVARKAMTKPMRAAFAAACVVYFSFGEGMFDLSDAGWFAPSTDDDAAMALVGIAVPFVRCWPDAPPEALYTTVRDAPFDLGLSGAWLDLPARNRMAWECFRDTLILIDRMMAVELARNLGVDEARESRRVPIDETTLETVDDPSDLTEIGRAMARREAAAAD